MDIEKNKGIKCNVTSCDYNRENNVCVAKEVDITCCGCKSANTCAQTECKTFRPKYF